MNGTDVGVMTERRIRVGAALAGLTGTVALTVYFAAPAFSSWPYAGASAPHITSYALGHETLFYAGAWFQVTGTLLCVIFQLALLKLADAQARLPGLLVIVGSSTLLAVVLIEAALLAAVPGAAASGDSASVVTLFDLSNGAFVRVFPLAPASLTYIALGMVVLKSGVLGRRFGYVSIGLGIAFELAGIIAVFSGAGLVLTIVLSVGQELWIVAAALALWRTSSTPAPVHP